MKFLLTMLLSNRFHLFGKFVIKIIYFLLRSQENDIENQEIKEDDSTKANKAALNYLESIGR